ncbi:MAG: ribosome-associated translation inhibitor RaiA [Kofleriaceae bacterium]|nr:ribosome-associated translation inhibitor RaiA [Kofleriaceae bacterium]
MNTLPDITYRAMESSPSIDMLIYEQIEKLERHCPSLISCRVVVSAPSTHHTKGAQFKVTVDLSVPGSAVIADRESTPSHAHDDCHMAVRDAFRAALKEVDRLHSRKTDQKRHPRA